MSGACTRSVYALNDEDERIANLDDYPAEAPQCCHAGIENEVSSLLEACETTEKLSWNDATSPATCSLTIIATDNDGEPAVDLSVSEVSNTDCCRANLDSNHANECCQEAVNNYSVDGTTDLIDACQTEQATIPTWGTPLYEDFAFIDSCADTTFALDNAGNRWTSLGETPVSKRDCCKLWFDSPEGNQDFKYACDTYELLQWNEETSTCTGEYQVRHYDSTAAEN